MNENGSKWARAGLVFGVIASVTGNVANACLTESQASILLRVPLAVVWPVALFIGVEVLVRNRAARGPLARIGQGGLLSVTVPTAITSFVNLHALMIKAGEPGMAQLSGPLAIDGLMLGCTVMLLAVRVHVATAVSTPPVATDPFAAWESELDTVDMDMASATQPEDTRPVSPAPWLVRSNEIKPESVPDTARQTFEAWVSADPAERPAKGQMYAWVAGDHGVSVRTARRWWDATRASI